MSARPAASRRVELRPPLLTDAAALSAAVSESLEGLRRRMRWPKAAVSEADAVSFLKRAFEEEAAGAALHYVVVEPKDGRLAGMAALQRLKVEPGVAELSLWIRQSRQERGLGTLAAREMIDLGLKRKLQRFWVRIEPSNRAARRVAQKLGFKYEGRLRRDRRLNGRWIDQECWGLLREEARG